MYVKTMTPTKSTTCGRCGEHTDYATWNVLDDEWQCPRCAGKNLDDLKDDDDEDADSEDNGAEDSEPDFQTEKYSYMMTSTMKTSRTILVPGDHVSGDVVEELEDEFGTQDGHLKCPEELNDEVEVTLSQVADVAGIEVAEDDGDEDDETDEDDDDVEEPNYIVRARTTTGSWGQEIEIWHVVPDESPTLMDDDKAETQADVEDALESNHKGELVLDDETVEQVERGDELTAPELLALVNGGGVETDGGYESRLGTSQEDDVEEFVPAEAETLFDSLPPMYSPIYVTDDALYNSDVHCRRCYCDVSRSDRESGEVACPNCGWSSEDVERSWEDVAEELTERGDVSWRRAQVVALIDDGRTHAEVAEELDLSDRREVSTHVRRYRDSRDKTEWLAEYGPEI